MCLAEILGKFSVFSFGGSQPGLPAWLPRLGGHVWPPMGRGASLFPGVTPGDVLNNQGHALLFTAVFVHGRLGHLHDSCACDVGKVISVAKPAWRKWGTKLSAGLYVAVASEPGRGPGGNLPRVSWFSLHLSACVPGMRQRNAALCKLYPSFNL